MVKVNNIQQLNWKEFRSTRALILALTIPVVLLVIWATATPSFFRFIQDRKGTLLSDPILNVIPAFDVSTAIFLLLYLLIFSAMAALLKRPHLFVIAVNAYAWLTLFRIITLLLFPLENPENLLPLHDPFVDRFFYQQTITKDLFFSGHTSIIFLLAIVVDTPKLKTILFVGSATVGLLLLVQHAHYLIDILAAPVFAYLSFWISKTVITRLHSPTIDMKQFAAQHS